MSFGGNTDSIPNRPPKPLGVDDRRLSTSEQARPVPYVRGTRPVGVTFISDFFAVKRSPVTTSAGKDEQVTGHNHFASFACLIGVGPATRLSRIIINNESVWPEDGMGVNFNGADSLTVSFKIGPKQSTVTVYAGTETQLPDAYLIEGTGVEHPAYRGFIYAVFKGLFLGFNQDNAPNIEFMVMSAPSLSWTGFTAPVDPPARVNAIAAAAEILQHPRAGLALPDSMLDTAALDAAAEVVNDETIGILPIFDRAQEARSAITEVLQYAGAFPIITGEGKFSVGLHRPPADLEALPVVTESMFTRRPEREAGDWLAAYSETRMKLRASAGSTFRWGPQYDSVSVWRDRGLLRITGEHNAQTLDRGFLHKGVNADNVLRALGRSAAIPQSGGRLYLRKMGTNFSDLAPGAAFKLNYPSRGITGQVCRVRERIEAAAGAPEFTVDYDVDFSWLVSQGGDTSEDPPQGGSGGSPKNTGDNTPVGVVVELPLELCPDGKLSLAALVMREEETWEGFNVHLGKYYDFDADPAESYSLIATVSHFAQRCKVLETYPITGHVDQTLGVLVQIQGADLEIEEQTPFDAVSGELLIFLGSEICSVIGAELIEIGIYRLKVMRGRYGTEVAAHVADTVGWIIRRDRIKPLQHPHFDVGNTATLKLQWFDFGVPAALSTVDQIDYVITGRIYKEPAPANLRVNGQLSDATYTTGQDITLDWTLTVPDADWFEDDRLQRRIVIELLDESLVLQSTDETPAGTFKLTNAELQTRLGGETSFWVRVKLRTKGDMFMVDSEAATLFVTKL